MVRISKVTAWAAFLKSAPPFLSTLHFCLNIHFILNGEGEWLGRPLPQCTIDENTELEILQTYFKGHWKGFEFHTFTGNISALPKEATPVINLGD
jgi:hypothetical protein